MLANPNPPTFDHDAAAPLMVVSSNKFLTTVTYLIVTRLRQPLIQRLRLLLTSFFCQLSVY
jgi:hypothetical protein